ncbi:hypothetical protein LCGC14_1252250 [marine sediment metagenome]|uniref:Uncharacterized protein n=1 Tax=marine sediment metagenome TaxID=412755 RepID=A0A0F9P6N2_9ZZZZ
MRDWFGPGELTFATREEVEWGLAHIEQLSNGSWPKQESGYSIEPDAHSRRSKMGGFEVPIQASAELERRVDSIGPDAFMAELNRGYGFSFERLGKIHNLEEHVVTYRCHCAIRFMIGQNFKASKYRRDHVAAYTGKVNA